MKYKHADNIVYAPREDGSIVLTDIDESEGVFLKLNEVSKDIWLFIEDGLTHDEIHEKMSDTYDPYDEDARTKVDAFIKDLVERKLIVED